MALKIAIESEELAYARDDNKETALHLLARNQNPLDSCCHCPEMEGSFRINPGKFLRSLVIRKIQTSGLSYLFICRVFQITLLFYTSLVTRNQFVFYCRHETCDVSIG